MNPDESVRGPVNGDLIAEGHERQVRKSET